MPKTASEERKEKLEALRQALVDGEQSGLSEDFDIQEFIAEVKRYRAA